MSNYLISISGSDARNSCTIHDIRSKLKVKASNLRSHFKTKKGELSFFVTAGKEKLAFQTEGYGKQHQLLVLQMISWYCVYLGLIEAQIHATVPAL